VAFHSGAVNLVPRDTNGVLDVFLHDPLTGTTIRASVANGGTEAVGGIDNNNNVVGSNSPLLSGDGRYVAFRSLSVNVVDGDTNGVMDVFVHDARMYQRRRVNLATGGGQSTAESGRPAVNGDGRIVAFESRAATLIAGDTNGAPDVFVHDRGTGTTTRVSVASGGSQAAGDSDQPSLSADGRYVAFRSSAPNLVPGDTNASSDVFVHDRATGETTRVSIATGGAQGSSGSGEPAISGDGRYVAFYSDAPDLVAGDTNGRTDIFVHDRVTGGTKRVNVTTSGGQAAGGDSYRPRMSADGRYVAFASFAPNLVLADTNGVEDVFVHDLLTGATTRGSVGTGGVQAIGGDSFFPSISEDGRYLVFTSLATNLVVGDSNNLSDVFVHDRVTGETKRVSVTTGGFQSGGDSYESSLSANGRYVAFYTSAPNLVANDTNGAQDVFVHDRATGETIRASLGPGESQGNQNSALPALSADGRVLAYQSYATDLVTGDTNNTVDVFVRAVTPVLWTASPHSGPVTGGTTIRIDGVGFAPGTTMTVGGLAAIHVDANSRTRLSATTPPNVAGLASVAVTVPGFEPESLTAAYTFLPLSASSAADSDGDGMPDGYEVQYSLDPLDPSDALRDPDGDGVPTVAERAAGTHPTGTVTRYLAEGATSGFFRTTLALTNPGDGNATVLLHFLPVAGSPVSHALRVPPRSRRTLDVGSLPGLATAEFSTVLESDRLVVLDRTMRWDASGYGSHTETALPALSTTWYLAEGATHSGFDLFYLLQNAASTPTAVQVTFFRPAPLAPVVKFYTLAPESRFNIWVDLEDPGLANTDVSASIVASQPIAVERAMYLSRGGNLFTAGHQSAGVTAPALSWFLAEGATGPFFDLFVLLANPNDLPADVRVSFLKADGSTVVKSHQVAPRSRFNIWVDLEDPALADAAVSTTVQVTNGVPIVVERSMWWPGGGATWHEAHNSAGGTSTGTAWIVANGENGGTSNAETYVLAANTALFEATIRVTLLFEDGASAARHYVVPPRSRLNVPTRLDFPGSVGRRFGVLVESVGLGAAPLAVESAVYSDAGGVPWAAGANALATRLR
jgi:Tol biopolymer transport system component